jgi:hypothetical protein
MRMDSSIASKYSTLRYSTLIDQIGNISLGVESYHYDLGHGSFVDSGTTLVYAHDAIFNAFMETFSQYCDENPG